MVIRPNPNDSTVTTTTVPSRSLFTSSQPSSNASSSVTPSTGSTQLPAVPSQSETSSVQQQQPPPTGLGNGVHPQIMPQGVGNPPNALAPGLFGRMPFQMPQF